MLLEVGLLIVAPALGWILYHYYKDRFHPEPLAAALWTFLAGVLAGFFCLELYRLGNRLGLVAGPEDGSPVFFVYLVVGVGVVEEVAKFLPFRLLSMNLRHFDDPGDGIFYASLAGLGFAAYENWQYLQFLDGAPMVGRALASPLTHAMFASLWGYACGRARFTGRRVWPAALGALAVAAMIHGTYDFLVLARHPALRPATAAIILVIWIWRMERIRRLQHEHGAGGSPA
jgi:RsiW-degrading membrane proteinase PrsW (M82 family)